MKFDGAIAELGANKIPLAGQKILDLPQFRRLEIAGLMGGDQFMEDHLDLIQDPWWRQGEGGGQLAQPRRLRERPHLAVVATLVDQPQNPVPVAAVDMKAGGQVLVTKAQVSLHNTAVGEMAYPLGEGLPGQHRFALFDPGKVLFIADLHFLHLQFDVGEGSADVPAFVHGDPPSAKIY